MSGTPPRFTVLLPVHRPPDLLPFAIESVLAQEEESLELLVVCDGTPPATVARAEEYAARDPRVRVMAFPKGERHGERHRHTALESARGQLVAQIGDDDMWFPAYLRELGRLLEEVEFGNLIQAEIQPDGDVRADHGDLDSRLTRQRMLDTVWNCFGPTFAGYRMETYRRLPVGWSPAPLDLPTDLYMWRKFLRLPDLRAGTRFAVEGVKLAALSRAGVDLDSRATEARSVAALVATEGGRREVQARAMAAVYRDLHGQLAAIESSRSWTFTAPLRRVSGFGRARIRGPLRGGRG